MTLKAAADPVAGTALVTLADLSVAVGGRMLIADLNAEIRAGEFIALLGPNGSGKTTLLRVLLGLQPASAGTVLINGRPPGRGSPLVGYAPQGRLLDRDLPVRGHDLVALGFDGHRWGVPLLNQREKQRRVAAAIEAVGEAATKPPYKKPPQAPVLYIKPANTLSASGSPV